MNKAGIANRLSKAGLRNVAEAYREEVRIRLAAAQGGKDRDRDKVSLQAWQEMWDLYRPVVERLEQKDQAGEPDPLTWMLDEDLDQFLDPYYEEADPGKWLRDGLLWTAAEIRRVVADSGEGTTVDLSRAKSKPPTAWAVFCLEAYARKPPSRRGDLIAQVLRFAAKVDSGTAVEEDKDEGEGFLHEIGGID